MKHNSNIRLFKIMLIGVLGLTVLGIIVSGHRFQYYLHWYSNRVVTLLCGGDSLNNHYLYL